ncbi:MAG: hypothetical protein OXR73_20205 [Myxococcales bacterium]|nr:hypothetical protein [Myxococcales bacterium]
MASRHARDADHLRLAIEAARGDPVDTEQLRRLAARLNVAVPPQAWAELPAKPASGALHGVVVGTSIALLSLGAAWLLGGFDGQRPQRHSTKGLAPTIQETPASHGRSAPPAQLPRAEGSVPAVAPHSATEDETARASSAPSRLQRPSPARRRADPRVRRKALASSDPRAELELLRRARQALEHDVAQASELLRQHEQVYPKGLFVQEREVLWVDVLRKRGEVKRATERAKAFDRRFPDSPHRHRWSRPQP